MLEEGRISPTLASAALERHRAGGDRFEEVLIGCGLPESMLLKHLAEMFNTRYISTKTLSGALVPRLTLARLPRRLCERYQVVPIRFADDDVLTVVATEPANPQLLESVRVAAGARLVMALVARPAAISAAIAKLYGGESDAFAQLSSRENGAAGGAGSGPAASEDPFPEVQLDTSAFENPGTFASRAFDNSGFESQRFEGSGVEHPGYGGSGFEGQSFDEAPHTDVEARSPSYEPPSYEPPQQSYNSAPAGLELGLGEVRPQPNGAAASAWVPSSDPDPELDMGIARARSLALGDASKLAESLMIIHERTRGSLKSHSVRVARLSYSLCRQLDLSEAQAAQAWAIGLFHDLGKSQQNHLTALNIWQLEDYEVTARAQYKNPGRLLKNADVPETVLTAILHMYERFDGKGFPNGLADEAIPFQSRVVALCDSVADLTLNPANTLGRIVSPLEACNHIRAQTPKVFDPTLLAHFSRLLVERKLDGAFLSDQSVHGIEKLLG
jgi:Type II secretion system (T2SS), protein E, N-terminal domain/HD domain